MRSLPEIAAEIMARRGLDPNAPTVEPPPFDPTEFRLEQAELALAVVVPNRFHGAAVDHPRAAEWVRQFHADRATCGSLLLGGTRGTGKSHLAFAALREIALTAARTRRPVAYRVVTHPDFNDKTRPKKDDSHEHAVEPYAECDLLVFDDLGAGLQKDWAADCLYRLVNHRWSNNLPTIYTTNLDPDDLTSAVGERVVSRVFDSTRVVLSGADRRGFSKGGQK